MARTKHEFEKVLARLTPGTTARMKEVVVAPETVADFIRQAIERELKRRARKP